MKINLASGQRPFYGDWKNVDMYDQPDQRTGKVYPLDYKTDVKDLSMIPDDSVDIMIAHHLVEHIAIHDLDAYIGEWYKKLRKGGILTVFVPNLKELDKAWLEGRIDTFIHNVNTFGAYQGHVEDLHKWGYDMQELKDRMSGWNGKERKYEWADIRLPNYNDPRYNDADVAHDWWILELEFEK